MGEAKVVKYGKNEFLYVVINNAKHLFTLKEGKIARERAKKRDAMIKRRETDVIY